MLGFQCRAFGRKKGFSMNPDPIRKIIHIDMDAFFASVEQKANPRLKGKPVIVGGQPGHRGVVAAASYEARVFGVRSAMPTSHAQRLCPDAIFVPPQFDLYKQVSQQIKEIFLSYTDLVEPLSLDEAFLDITGKHPSATWVANEIRTKIFQKTGLTASAGVAPGKFLAKIASEINKPNGIFVITPDEVLGFIERLPIRKFFGIGEATEEKMLRLGIRTGKDLQEHDLDFMVRNFGKTGVFYFQISRGIDQRQVKPERERKSISVERTFPEDIYSLVHLDTMLKKVCQELEERMLKKVLAGRTVHLKIRFENFETLTRSHSRSINTRRAGDFYETVKAMLSSLDLDDRGVRLLGVGCSNLLEANDPEQLTLPFDLT